MHCSSCSVHRVQEYRVIVKIQYSIVQYRTVQYIVFVRYYRILHRVQHIGQDSRVFCVQDVQKIALNVGQDSQM